MAKIYSHYEQCVTSYGVTYTGLFTDLNDCITCIVAHDTKPNYVMFGTLPSTWKVGEPMNYEYGVEIKYSDDIPSEDMIMYEIADKIHNLIRIFKNNPDSFIMSMQEISKTQKQWGPPFPEINYAEILYNWD